MTKLKTRNVLAAALFASLLIVSLPATVMAEPNTSDKTQFQKRENRFSSVDEQGNKLVSAAVLGWLQLEAHDLFFVERGDRINAETAIDFENGKLDLSTLLIDMTTGEPFSDKQIANGGEMRNSENIMLFTIASNLGQQYLEVRDAQGEQAAYESVMEEYNKWIKRTYRNTFDERFPLPQEGNVTATENLAFRTIHDLTSDQILIDGQTLSVFDPSLVGQTLDRRELRQWGSPLDGQFDAGFLNMEISLPNGDVIVFSLLDADSNFADQFETDFTFEFFLGEVEDGSYDENDEVMKQIRSLIAKGQNF